MFDWIKRNVKNAVIAGFNEAIAEVTGATRPLPQQAEVILALPAPDQTDDDGKVDLGAPTRKNGRIKTG